MSVIKVVWETIKKPYMAWEKGLLAVIFSYMSWAILWIGTPIG
jgi:hypothetical protein